MTSAFSTRIATGLARHASFAGHDAVYARGENVALLKAVPLVPQADGELGQQLTATAQAKYWGIPAFIVLDGEAIEPEIGDTLTVNGRVYEVTSPDGIRPAWRHQDGAETRIRVHTQMTGEAGQ